ncbi:MAG: efflux RND transporter periplasmic adaptor subunit [Alistipes sp.]
MKQRLFLGVCLATMLVSCGTKPREESLLRPVKVATVESLGGINKSFSGAVIPDQYSDLAFKVGGPLIALNVVEGQNVKQGQIVAEIDPFDYRLQYEAKKSSYLTAKSQLERAEKLLAKDAISRQDYESTQAAFDNAKAAFENAESLLTETKLRAPFDGFIQTKYVENYQKVQQGTSIVCLINPQLLQIRFTMPESNLEYFLSDAELFVEFENYKGILFKAKVKEYVPASTDGSGVPVYLTISDPRFNLKTYNVAVGFTCRVIMHHKNAVVDTRCVIPISSIFTVTGSDDFHVYVLDAKDSTVHLRKVKNDGVAGRDQMIVSEGLQNGDRVVVAGSIRLVDGQKVKVLTE